MVTYVEYLKSILNRIVDSYDVLEAIEDKPGDLKKIEKEMLKINGFVRVISNKIEIEKIPLADFKITKKKFAEYLVAYSFEKEIETMAPLYSNDVNRIKNMRLKILESLKNSDYVILLDDKGLALTSIEFSELLNKKMVSSNNELVFVVGGAFGFSESVYKRADTKLSLSKMTFSHQMVRLIFKEQLYRAFSILKGEKYHHE